ncbi:isopentenyl-diphosphate Delta-isomerase 1-like [Euwallacea fornicatus]|uniref:isopentenyl-diphosphate Delta-isomerase 1-like n=1 Tax=Euwallacea fornicatus TaxID=995702 RepID=UPI00338F2514
MLVQTDRTHMDPIQEVLLNEKCLLVDEYDHVIGETTKHDCHLVQNDGHIKLHRAFSVFLFNSNGDLLVQKRAATKITYPNRFTNTCCSHTLSDIPQETEEIDALGVKRAARRRLNYELGIPMEDLPIEIFKFVTRIHYKDQGDGKYGEHEIDYILCVQRDVNLHLNYNEVSEVRYVKKKDFDDFVQVNEALLTPWFHLICRYNLIDDWWENLHDLDQVTDIETILRLL